MKKKYIHISFLLLLIIATSCNPVYYVQVQIGEPGKGELPNNIQSLTLVNRATDSLFTNFNEDTLQQVFFKNKFKVDTVLYDKIASDTLVKAMSDLLYESGRYDIVVPENRFIPHKRNTFFSEEMPWNEVEELCKTFKTDALLSLDHFKTSVSTTYNSETMYDATDDRYFKAYVALIAIQYEALIRVYDPAQKKIIDRTFLKDTLLWENADLSSRILFKRLTSVKSALNEAGIAIALKYSDKISTLWRTGNRKYFNKGNTQLEQAHVFAMDNDWEQALAIWLATAEQARGKAVRSKAEFNVALGYEMLGDIKEAIKWGIKSYDTQYRPVTVEYLNILKKRWSEINEINKNG